MKHASLVSIAVINYKGKQKHFSSRHIALEQSSIIFI